MIISEEQARLAAAYLRSGDVRTGPRGDAGTHEVSSDLVERVRDSVATLPEVREDRIREARELMAGGCPCSGEVAGKMLARVVSDSLR